VTVVALSRWQPVVCPRVPTTHRPERARINHCNGLDADGRALPRRRSPGNEKVNGAINDPVTHSPRLPKVSAPHGPFPRAVLTSSRVASAS
jgi:hypothetical protein